MTGLPADVPLTVVVVHLAALVGLLARVAVIQLRRSALIRQNRDQPSSLRLRLLYALLGPPRA